MGVKQGVKLYLLTLYIKLKKIFISKGKGDGKEIKINPPLQPPLHCHWNRPAPMRILWELYMLDIELCWGSDINKKPSTLLIKNDELLQCYTLQSHIEPLKPCGSGYNMIELTSLSPEVWPLYPQASTAEKSPS